MWARLSVGAVRSSKFSHPVAPLRGQLGDCFRVKTWREAHFLRADQVCQGVFDDGQGLQDERAFMDAFGEERQVLDGGQRP